MIEQISDELQEDITLSSLIQINENRGAAYELLARLYRKEVDAELLEQLKRMRFPVFTGNERADEGYRLFAKFLSNTWENTLKELSVDFTRVFFGGGMNAFSAAYPVESVYTSPKRLTMQAARNEVLAIYRSQGLDKEESWCEGEDHISVEMEFMSIMIDRVNEALRNEDDQTAAQLLLVQKNFLKKHLAAWSPMMTMDMRRFAKTGLYKGLAYLTDGFLLIDQGLLEDVVVEEDDDEEEPEKE